MRQFIFIVLVVTSIYSCLTNKIPKVGIDTIEFGSGGGFSGLYSTYFVDLNNRSIRKDDGEPRQLRNKHIRLLLRKCTKYDFFQVEFDRPYNFNHFIKITGNEKINHIIWGDPTLRPPIEVVELYEILGELPEEP
jgi:hypothetical protein